MAHLISPLVLVQTGIEVHDYGMALRNARLLNRHIKKSDVKYKYLIDLEKSIEKIRAMYANYGGSVGSFDKCMQTIKKAINLLKK